MKPTQITELLANIKATFVSFFSILMFVALGVGIFLGISWSGPALQEAADRTFAEGGFHNFQVYFPYGLTEDDLEELSKVEGVSQVEGEYQSFQTVTVNGSRTSVKLQSMGNDIDKPQVVEGELPMRAGEIALHEASAGALGAGVGDTVTFEKDAAAEDKYVGLDLFFLTELYRVRPLRGSSLGLQIIMPCSHCTSSFDRFVELFTIGTID